MDVRINLVAQGGDPTTEGRAWFRSLSDDERLEAVRATAGFCGQADPTSDDITTALSMCGVGSLVAPAALLLSGTHPEDLVMRADVADVQATEDLFCLLLVLLTVSDGRHRRACPSDCSHWWHHLTGP